jgi:hypothetical protein
MSSAFQIVVGLLATLASNLSSSTVTKADLEKGTVPFRVEVSPEVTDGLITIKLIYDDRNDKRARDCRERGFLPRMHLDLKSASAEFPSHADNGNLIGKISVAPELALEGILVVFVGTGLNDHAYDIPLDLFATEIRNAKKVAGEGLKTSAKSLTKEDFENSAMPFSVRIKKSPHPLLLPPDVTVKYDLGGKHPAGMFKNSSRKDRGVQMTLYVNHSESNAVVAAIPLKLRTAVGASSADGKGFEPSELAGDIALTSEYATRSRVLVTLKGGSEEYAYMIPLGLFVEAKAD